MQTTSRVASLRRRTLAIAVVATLTLTVTLGASIGSLFLDGYRDLERDAALRDLARMQNALQADIRALETTTRDYAAWDDPYQWIESRDPRFLEVNFPDESFRRIGWTLVALIDGGGTLAYSKAFDLAADHELPAPGLDEIAQGRDHPLRTPPPDRVRSGTERFRDLTVHVVAHPILDSKGRGPARGVFITGRALDEGMRRRLSDLLQLDLRFQAPEALDAISPAAAAHFREKGEHWFEPVDERTSRVFLPVRDFSGRDVLVVEATLGRAVWQRGLTAVRALVGAVALACLLFGLAIERLIDRIVVRRVLRLSVEVEQVAQAADNSLRVSPQGSDEVGRLAGSINGMLAALQDLARLLEDARRVVREAFGRYVSEEVAEAILARPDPAALGGEVREVTILFSDLRGYSTISERLQPQDVVSLLNEYFGEMSEIIVAEGGCVIEFLGDAILAVFGAPNDLPGHADRAVRAALRMRERTDALNREWRARGVSVAWEQAGVTALASRIGIHAGRVVAGNLGSKRRMKYAVIGDVVNTASRVEGLNNVLGTDVLVTAEVKARLGDVLARRLVDRGAHPVKGRQTEVHVFAVAPEPGRPLE